MALVAMRDTPGIANSLQFARRPGSCPGHVSSGDDHLSVSPAVAPETPLALMFKLDVAKTENLDKILALPTPDKTSQ